jgi:two-component system chemotaxis response regulator CheB
MDVEMPIMNGIEAVKAIMATTPTPIVMLSALTSAGAEVTLEALSAGAVDFIGKPSGSISLDIKTVGEDILSKVKNVATAKVRLHKLQPELSSQKIRILLVDDSSFVRKTVSDIINREPDLTVIAEATNGKEALLKAGLQKPDVIIMDIDMPEMNGVNATFQIMKEHAVPVIIFSGKAANQMDDIKLALEVGAVDYLPKPTDKMALRSVAPVLIKKIRDAYSSKVKKITTSKTKAITDKILVIGTSTGGPQTLGELIPQIPADIPAGILIVQHMPPIFTKSLADRLDKLSAISVREAQEGDEILQGEALVAPGDFHMTVHERIINGQKRRYVSLNKEERLHGVRPAVDITFSSAANIFGANTVGVLLTGMGKDGANAMGLIKAKGGYTIAQDKQTSIIFGMPAEAIRLGVVDEVIPLNQIAARAAQAITSVRKKEVSYHG